jgi:hypothetical protein
MSSFRGYLIRNVSAEITCQHVGFLRDEEFQSGGVVSIKRLSGSCCGFSSVLFQKQMSVFKLVEAFTQ